MKNGHTCIGYLAIVASLSGCAGVPRLYRPARVNPDTTLAPKVEHIVDRITCELADISRRQLNGREYIVTVVLTLQVNDEINVTPSLSFIDVLATMGTTRTLTQNLGIGGTRERSFAANFYFNTLKLATQPGCDASPKLLYRLDGSLGLAEIARDGIGIGEHQAAGGSTPPTAPSFASQVKFVVTRSVSALGPTWSLLSFKGPGGANGLLNGKALTTDSVNIAFAEKKRDAAPATNPQIETLRILLETISRQEQELIDAVNRRRTELSLVLETERNKANRPGPRSLFDKRQSDRVISNARTAVGAAEQDRSRKALERKRVQDELVNAQGAANAAAAARSDAEAINTGQNLITTMILQNLTVQPR